MNKNQKRAKARNPDAETLTEILRRVLKETGPDGKSNAEAVAQAMIDSSKGGNLEVINTVLARAGVRVKVSLEF